MFSECVTCSISRCCHLLLFFIWRKKLVLGNRKVCAQKRISGLCLYLKVQRKWDFGTMACQFCYLYTSHQKGYRFNIILYDQIEFLSSSFPSCLSARGNVPLCWQSIYSGGAWDDLRWLYIGSVCWPTKWMYTTIWILPQWMCLAVSNGGLS